MILNIVIAPHIYDTGSTNKICELTRRGTCVPLIRVYNRTYVHGTPCTGITEASCAALHQSRSTYEVIRYSEHGYLLARVHQSCIAARHGAVSLPGTVYVCQITTYDMLTAAQSIGYDGPPGTPLYLQQVAVLNTPSLRPLLPGLAFFHASILGLAFFHASLLGLSSLPRRCSKPSALSHS